MRKLVMASGVVLAAAILTGALVSARDRATSIYLTKNYNQGSGAGQYPAECIGIVSTETLPAQRGDRISWKIKNGNGHNSDDVCPSVDKNQVELRFETDVFGVAAGKKLTGKGGSVDGQISMSATEAPMGPHKYRVYYKGLAAGPDPEIDIDCPGCGPPPGPPGPGGQ